MLVQSNPITLKPDYLRAKRRFDLIVTLLLLPFLCPLVLLVALAIHLDSRGPIFFRQTRIGQDGKAFTLLKFRSMAANNDDALHRSAVQRFIQGQPLNPHASNANYYKLANDQRITRVGRFIRKTSLDELPQFWNVLRGEMSLVGPRPPLPYEVALYSPHDLLRLGGKPGLTGLWQVCGRNRVPFGRMVQMDIAYLEAQSLFLDLQLIILTIPGMLKQEGA